MSRFIGNAITAADSSIYLKSKGIQVIDAHVWLEKLKDRVLPQPKQEWGEEDSMHLTNAIIAAEKEWGTESYTAEWLKSLKDILQLQPKQEWKPSDEQMNALNDVISSRDIKYDVLSELWKDLKQL